MSDEQLWSIPDDVESIYIHYTTEDLLKGFREEALRHREEISQLKTQLQQKENIIKEVREYIDKYSRYCSNKEYFSTRNPITDLKIILDKEVN